MRSDFERIFPLQEYEVVRLSPESLTWEEGEILLRQHSSRIAVEFPTPKTANQWELKSMGWVGFLPVTEKLALRLQPKVQLGNLFGMLEYAYRLKSFEILQGLTDCATLEDFYERLAHILARRILDRARKGFHREYLSHEERVPFLRGRLDLRRALRAPWQVQFDCSFQEHTTDIDDNQILAWTLSRILRTAVLQRQEILGSVRNAMWSLHGVATPLPVSPRACTSRVYNRLNDDYRPLHALCRFFLEQSGPTHEHGDRQMLPFLVDMARLFELFVAEWLRVHLPSEFECRAQETVPIGKGLEFAIDLVMYRREDQKAVCVLDTKYKASPYPAPADVQQIAAYAAAKDCRDAVLVYPAPLERPFEGWVGGIRVRSLAFDLGRELREAGESFLRELQPGLFGSLRS